MAAAAYSTLPPSTYAGFGSEGDPYHTNNTGTYDSGIGAIASHSHPYQTNGYDANIPDDDQQQQPMYSDEYQQSPYSNGGYNTQHPQNVPANTYAQPPPNNQQQQQQPFYSNEYQQSPYSNGGYAPQQPHNTPPNAYAQQQSLYPNEYQQSPYSNDGYSTQQPQNVLPNTYAQQPPNNQQPIYPNEYQQSPYSNDGYSTQQPPGVPSRGYAPDSVNNQQQQFNGHPNAQMPKTNNGLIPTNNNTESYPDMNALQPPHKRNMDNHFVEPQSYPQTSYAGTTQHRPSPPVDNQHRPSPPVNNQHHQSQPYRIQHERPMSNRTPKQEQYPYRQPQSPSQSENQISKPRVSLPSVHRRSPSIDNDNYSFDTVLKTNDSRQESKTSKSSVIPGASSKKKAATHEVKPKDQNPLSNENKITKPKSQNASSQTDEPSDLEKNKQNKKQPQPQSKTSKASHADAEQNDTKKMNRNKKQPHVESKSRKNRRDGYQTEDDYSTDDEGNNTCRRCKSRKTLTFSDTNLDKNSRLPPLRRGRMVPGHDPYIDDPLPPRRRSQRRFSYDDPPSHRDPPRRHDRHNMHKDIGNIPSHRNGKMNPYIDHEDNRGDKSHRSRMSKNKNTNFNDHVGQKSRHGPEEYIRSKRPSMRYSPDYYDERDMNDHGRQERRGNSKMKLQSSVPDIPFSQPMRSDSYVENERRRAVRDAQGYYFPYKQYTLQDYNNLKKTFVQNPYSGRCELPVDRRELAKKRQEYGTAIEKQIIDSPEMPPREMGPVKPWHLGTTGKHDPDEASKRERAIEYAKVQVKKYQALNSTRNHSDRSDSEQYGSKPYSKMNGDVSNLRVCSICNGVCAKQKPNTYRKEKVTTVHDGTESVSFFNVHLYEVVSVAKYSKNTRGCFAELKCGERSENLSIAVQGLPGLMGTQGITGLPGPMGPRGLTGPPGRDGFIERPPSFYAELRRLYITKNIDSLLRPWILSEAANTPDVYHYFSQEKGIFTVPTGGLYHFFLTISVSKAKASVYISRNGERIRTVWVESIATIHNETLAWGWATGSIDSLLHCQTGDQISVIASYRPSENFNSQVYGYSYSTFSGYMLYNA